MNNINSFLSHVFKYIHTYSNFRPSFGIGMNGNSPIEKLKKLNILNSNKFNNFPIFLLENLKKIVDIYLKDHYKT